MLKLLLIHEMPNGLSLAMNERYAEPSTCTAVSKNDAFSEPTTGPDFRERAPAAV